MREPEVNALLIELRRTIAGANHVLISSSGLKV
jgi:hypothetical protein